MSAILMPRIGVDNMIFHIIGNAHNILCRKQLYSKTLGLLNDTLGKLCTRHTFGETRVVIQAFGNACLPTQPAALDHQDIKAITSSINSRGERRGTSTHKDQVVELRLGPGLQSQLSRHFCIRWLNEYRPIFKDNGWNGQAAILDFLHKGLALHILFDVDKFVVDALLSQEFFTEFAITAPVRAVKFDVGMSHVLSFHRIGTWHPQGVPLHFSRHLEVDRPLQYSHLFCKYVTW